MISKARQEDLFERNRLRENWNLHVRGILHVGKKTELFEKLYADQWARKIHWVSPETLHEVSEFEDDKDYPYNLITLLDVDVNTPYLKRLSSMLDRVEHVLIISKTLQEEDLDMFTRYLDNKNYKLLHKNTEDTEGTIVFFTRRNWFNGIMPDYKVNIFDSVISHSSGSSGNFPTYFDWVKGEMSWDGITIFTDVDVLLKTALIQQVKSKIKIGWLMESKAIIRYDPNYIWRIRELFDYVFTHDKTLIDADPEKFLFVTPGSQRCLHPLDCKIYNKEKLVSIAVSLKRDTDGHAFRHAVVEKYRDKITDVWGFAYREFLPRLVPYKDYMFMVVIENNTYDHYWSEKLLEPIWTGTVPIYKGCHSFPDWFDPNGVITFDTMDELGEILDNLNEDMYYERMDSIRENYNRSLKYLGGTEDFFFTEYPNIFSKENTP